MERSNCCRGCSGGWSGSSSCCCCGGGCWSLLIGFVDSNFRLGHRVYDGRRLILRAGDVGEGEG